MLKEKKECRRNAAAEIKVQSLALIRFDTGLMNEEIVCGFKLLSRMCTSGHIVNSHPVTAAIQYLNYSG